MRRALSVALGLLCGAGLSCGGKSVEAPVLESQLQVFVHWQDQGLAERRLEILELDIAQSTNVDGVAEFALAAGTFTLRAYVTSPGPMPFRDISVTTQEGRTTRVEVIDCLLCR